LRNTE